MKRKAHSILIFSLLILGILTVSPATTASNLELNQLYAEINNVWINNNFYNNDGKINQIEFALDIFTQEADYLHIGANFYDNETGQYLFYKYRDFYLDDYEQGFLAGNESVFFPVSGWNFNDMGLNHSILVQFDIEVGNPDNYYYGNEYYFDFSSHYSWYELDPALFTGRYTFNLIDFYSANFSEGDDGKTDMVEFIFEINATKEGYYYAYADFRVNNTHGFYEYKGWGSSEPYLYPGIHNISILFKLYREVYYNNFTGFGAYYTVDFNYKDNNNYYHHWHSPSMQSYDSRDLVFGPPMIEVFEETLTMNYVDDDRNGLFDYVEFSININIYHDLFLNVYMNIWDQYTGFDLGSAKLEGNFYKGNHQLYLQFDPRNSGVIGYMGDVDYNFGLMGSPIGFDDWYFNHEFNNFTYLDLSNFELPPVAVDYNSLMIEFLYNEGAVSLDVSGYDYVAISFVLMVQETAWVDLYMDALIGDEYQYHNIADTFGVGNHTITFTLDGKALYETYQTNALIELEFGGYTEANNGYELPYSYHEFYINYQDFNPDGVAGVPPTERNYLQNGELVFMKVNESSDTYDYVEFRVELVVKESANIEVGVDVDAEGYYNSSSFSQFYNQGKYLLVFAFDGKDFYNTNATGGSIDYRFFGHSSSSGGYDLNEIKGSERFNYYDFSSQGSNDNPNNGTTDDTGNSTPSLDLPLPMSPLWISLLALFAIPVITRKRY